ncbi:MAG: HlyD family efflux transporter periplasmic adaptor subunit [Planctomycetes bacterium]|nr:HlyD family efflux transporter periplasmic adaptor subunit [Planctomycetota bacterium]
MKRGLAAVALLILFAVGVFGVSRSDVTAAGDGKSLADQEVIVLSNCRIKLKKRAILATDRPGILSVITPEEGSKVEKGEVVAALKSEVAIAAVNVAEMKAKDRTEIEYAKLARDQAKVEVEKANEVNRNEPGTISVIEIQRLKLEEEKAKASVKKAESGHLIAQEQAKEAVAQLATFKVVAPFAGVVTRKMKSVGEAVRQGDPILEIVNTKTVVVEGRIPYRDRRHIQVGNKVMVLLEHRDADGRVTLDTSDPLPGKIVFIDETVEKVSGKIFVKVEVVNTGKTLLPGLTARMTIYPGTKFQEPKTGRTPK